MQFVGDRTAGRFAREAWKRGDAPNAEPNGIHVNARGFTTTAES